MSRVGTSNNYRRGEKKKIASNEAKLVNYIIRGGTRRCVFLRLFQLVASLEKSFLVVSRDEAQQVANIFQAAFSPCDKFIITLIFQTLFSQQWCDELVKLAYNLNQLNGSSTMFLQKAHVKLSLQVDKSGRIPVKKWVKELQPLCLDAFAAPHLAHIFIASDIDFVIKSLLSAPALPPCHHPQIFIARKQTHFNEMLHKYKLWKQLVENVCTSERGQKKGE